MALAARQHAAQSALPASPRRPGGGRRAPRERVIATRRHGAAAPAGPQPLVRATAGIRTNDRPHLVLVAPRGRRATHLAVVASVVLGVAMMGAAAFQTQLAQRQVELDRLDRDISAARERYEVLRRERAELRSPGRLSQIAAANGMVPSSDSELLTVQPDVLAIVAASTGAIDPEVLGDGPSTLDDFREVKAITSGAARDRVDTGTDASEVVAP